MTFFDLKKKNYQLKDTEITALKGYYKAKYDIPAGTPELREMDTIVEFWGGFRNDTLIFKCARALRKHSTRLNHLAHIESLEDANRNYRDGTRNRNFQPLEEYAYIQFFCVHRFRADHNMLVYNLYRRTEIVDGLVRDLGFKSQGWADVVTLKYLCARVIGKDNHTYFVDDPEKMVGRLRNSLGI